MNTKHMILYKIIYFVIINNKKLIQLIITPNYIIIIMSFTHTRDQEPVHYHVTMVTWAAFLSKELFEPLNPHAKSPALDKA